MPEPSDSWSVLDGHSQLARCRDGSGKEQSWRIVSSNEANIFPGKVPFSDVALSAVLVSADLNYKCGIQLWGMPCYGSTKDTISLSAVVARLRCRSRTAPSFPVPCFQVSHVCIPCSSLANREWTKESGQLASVWSFQVGPRFNQYWEDNPFPTHYCGPVPRSPP